MAGTAYGNISTNTESLLDPPPPNARFGTGCITTKVSWRNYFTDLPSVGVIGSTVGKVPAEPQSHRAVLRRLRQRQPASVSIVDPEFGVAGEVGGPLATLPALQPIAEKLNTTGGSEENPQDMAYGEYWASKIVKALLSSPAWPRTLLIYTYDEHGGYYDTRAPAGRDSLRTRSRPSSGPATLPGATTSTGRALPAVVVSPYSKPNAVTNVVHDHTSFLATVEAKWNLPVLTYRDANAEDGQGLPQPGSARFHATARDRRTARSGWRRDNALRERGPMRHTLTSLRPSVAMVERRRPLARMWIFLAMAICALAVGSSTAVAFTPPKVRHVFRDRARERGLRRDVRQPQRRPLPRADAAGPGSAARKLLRDRACEQRQLHLARLRPATERAETRPTAPVRRFHRSRDALQRRRDRHRLRLPGGSGEHRHAALGEETDVEGIPGGHGQQPQPRGGGVRASCRGVHRRKRRKPCRSTATPRVTTRSSTSTR